MQNEISHDEFVKKATAKAINNAVLDSMEAFSEDYDDPELTDDDTSGELQVDLQKIADEAEKAESFDIFSLGQTLVDQGSSVAYTVRKGGKMFTHLDHPFSWKEMQKHYGAGTYKVTLRLPELNNRYIKTQSQTLADPPPEIESKTHGTEVRTTAPNSSVPNFTDVMERMERQRREEREQAKQDAKEREELIFKLTEIATKKDENKSNVTETVTALLGALAPVLAPLLTRTDSSSSTQTLMLEMQKMNMENQKQQMQTTMELLKAQQEQTRQMFEGLRETISSIADEKEDTGSGLDPMTYLKEIREAEDRGFEKFKLLNDLADEKAKEKSSVPAKEESTTDVLLKSAIPMLGMMFQKGQQVQAPVAPQIAHAPAPIVEPRGSLHNRVPTHAVDRRQVSPRVGNPQAQTHGQPKVVPVTKPSVSHGKGGGQNPVKNNPVVADKNLGTINHGGALTGKIKDLVIPVIVDAYSRDESDRGVVIARCVQELNAHNIPLHRVGTDFTAGHVEEIITEFGLPEAFSQTLRELHYELLVQTGNTTEVRPNA
jgi:hypothetical protein